MSAKRFLQIGSVAALAALVTGGLALAQPRPAAPPAVGPPAPPPVALAAGPPPPVLATPPPAGSALLGGLAGARPFIGGIAPPSFIPPQSNPLVMPRVGSLPTLSGASSNSLTAPLNFGTPPPSANQFAVPKPTFNTGNIMPGDLGPRHWSGYYGWNGHPPYIWNEYSSDYSYQPFDRSYSYSDSYDYYHPYDADYYRRIYRGYAQGESYRVPWSLSYARGADSYHRSSPSRTAASNKSAVNTDGDLLEADGRMDTARLCFRKGNYADAQTQCEKAIGILPGDVSLHEFRALCQFAQGKYKEAASALHKVFPVGPVWSWTTLSSFYTSPSTYTTHLRALEQYVRNNPKDSSGRFVLGYHYLALGRREAAIGEFREIVKLEPTDEFSRDIFATLEGRNISRGASRAQESAPNR